MTEPDRHADRIKGLFDAPPPAAILIARFMLPEASPFLPFFTELATYNVSVLNMLFSKYPPAALRRARRVASFSLYLRRPDRRAGYLYFLAPMTARIFPRAASPPWKMPFCRRRSARTVYRAIDF